MERTRSSRALLASLVAVSGILSALFINDTICLTLTPLVLAAIAPLGLAPLPFLLAIALASNVGSAMAITGNPQNMLIGIASGMRFGRFTATLALPSLGGLVIVYLVLARLFRAELAQPLRRQRERPAYEFDRTLVIKALLIFAGALVAWLVGGSLPGVAIAAGALMVAIPTIVVYALLQRHFISGLTLGASKG
jgi:Na+/H+ antiporter NhaD/arsenite permease-like protein